jgi:hypothetical protein
MADNFAFTPGSGATGAADDVSGVLYQRVKLDGGGDGASTPVLAGGGVEASAMRVTIASDSTGVVSVDDNGSTVSVDDGAGSLTVDGTVSLTDISAAEYETVAASQTAQVLGPTGGTGDYISHLLVIPATVSPGNVLLLDNATSITVFAGGTNSVLTLHPFTIALGMKSVSGAWKVTTGANVSVIGVGNFT